METLARIEAMIEERHLLTHSFYTRWVAGDLPAEAIREYAARYYHFESAFPRFLSAIHSRTDDSDIRQILLDNLWDEEAGEDNHVELWLRFAEGVGRNREDVRECQPSPATRRLVDTYRTAAEGSVAGGVAALYAYESQIPAVAGAKIRGLRDHYEIADNRTLTFWLVHERLDVEHASNERAALATVADVDPDSAIAGTGDALDAWWGFLTEVEADAA
ncbi:MAG: CADD family putative folate metabolism protein [Actinomycetota bacterium]